MRIRAGFYGAVLAGMAGMSALAQTPPPAPPDAPPPPLVIGRDAREPGEVIGKNFLLRVWLSDVGGAGMQKIYVVRLGADGNITIPGTAPQHAEGLTIAALEAQVAAPFKAAAPTAKAWISIVDRTPPPPPAPPAPAAPPAPVAAPVPAPTTKPAVVAPKPVAATQPAALATKPVALVATKPATAPVK